MPIEVEITNWMQEDGKEIQWLTLVMPFGGRLVVAGVCHMTRSEAYAIAMALTDAQPLKMLDRRKYK